MGTGETDWVPMPATVQLRTGSQGAAFMFVNARIQGLTPGNPANFLDENNPRTRIQATLVDGTVIGGDCPSRVGYVANPDGYDHWQMGQMLVFLPFSAETTANNTNVSITLEVIDSAHHYAKAQKTILVTPRNTAASAPPHSDESASP